MVALLSNRWLQVSATGIIAAAIFTVVGISLGSGGPEGPLVGPVAFATGGTVDQIGEAESRKPAVGQTTQVDLPLTAAEAVAAGWIDAVLCSVGRGRYFQKGPADEGEPYVLMFNSLENLIGVYLFSETEMPPPWEEMDELKSVGRTKIVDFAHWGLFLYFQDPLRACRTTEAAEGSGNVFGGQASQKRSAPTAVVPPTPTPTAGQVLESVVARMARVASVSFTLTGEPEGAPLSAGTEVQKVEGTLDSSGAVTLTVTGSDGTALDVPASLLPFSFGSLGATLSGITGALQEPVDTKAEWIDNRPKRGISGTVLGGDLGALVPAAVADARAAVTLWVDDEGRIRRLRIEGAVTPDDPPEAVRVLNLSGYGE